MKNIAAKVSWMILATATAFPANAAVIQLSGTADATGIGLTPNPFVLTWSGTFDDSSVTGIGFEIFTAGLDVFKLNGKVGGTTFDTTNTAMQLLWNSGTLLNVRIGDSGSVDTVTPGTDEFLVDYGAAAGIIYYVAWTNASDTDSISTPVGPLTGNLTVGPAASTPEPGVILPALLTGVLLPWAYWRRRSSSAFDRLSAAAT